jgi:hypothetical protein
MDVSGDEAVEDVPEEAVSEKAPQKASQRSVAEGRFVVPRDWPKWKKQCGVVKQGRPPCRSYAVIGMPTCKFHGSGGVRNRQLGQMRYLAWVTLGAPETLIKGAPIEHITRLALGTFAEYIFSDKNNVSTDTQIKAALWLADTGRHSG